MHLRIDRLREARSVMRVSVGVCVSLVLCTAAVKTGRPDGWPAKSTCVTAGLLYRLSVTERRQPEDEQKCRNVRLCYVSHCNHTVLLCTIDAPQSYRIIMLNRRPTIIPCSTQQSPTIIPCCYAQLTPHNHTVFLCSIEAPPSYRVLILNRRPENHTVFVYSIDAPQSYCVLMPNRRPTIIPYYYAQSMPHNHTVFLYSTDAPKSYRVLMLSRRPSHTQQTPCNCTAPFCNTQLTHCYGLVCVTPADSD
jgi:hypothetical protein